MSQVQEGIRSSKSEQQCGIYYQLLSDSCLQTIPCFQAAYTLKKSVELTTIVHHVSNRSWQVMVASSILSLWMMIVTYVAEKVH